jgi:hypothetical protein
MDQTLSEGRIFTWISEKAGSWWRCWLQPANFEGCEKKLVTAGFREARDQWKKVAASGHPILEVPFGERRLFGYRID